MRKKIPKFQKCPVGGLFWPLRASHGPCVHAKGLKMIPCERLIDSGPFEKKMTLFGHLEVEILPKMQMTKVVKMMEMTREQ